MTKGPTKAVIKNESTNKSFSVMFNPTQLTSQTKLNIGSEGGSVQFQSLSTSDFSVDLFFDTYETGKNVSDAIQPLEALQKPSVGEQAKKEPPTCTFSWGSFKFTGILVDLTRTFTMFKPDGTPVRAEVNATFKSIETVKQNLESKGLDNCRKLTIVKEGERLDLIAARMTGAASNWREIAAANGVDDPLAFPDIEMIGQLFVIPDLVSDG